MKRLIFIAFCFVNGAIYSQDLPNSGFEKVRVIEPTKVIVAEIKQPSSKPSVKKDLFYAWYSANTIHATQGGYSGKLLNGQYNEYYLNKNLKEQGTYLNGLKNGSWKDWNEDGSLLHQSAWKNGIILPDSTVSFWKRLPLIRKRKHQQEKADPKS
jgi:antitoxin component YwqK of YwqJK toxin-antitoxin module